MFAKLFISHENIKLCVYFLSGAVCKNDLDLIFKIYTKQNVNNKCNKDYYLYILYIFSVCDKYDMHLLYGVKNVGQVYKLTAHVLMLIQKYFVIDNLCNLVIDLQKQTNSMNIRFSLFMMIKYYVLWSFIWKYYSHVFQITYFLNFFERIHFWQRCLRLKLYLVGK